VSLSLGTLELVALVFSMTTRLNDRAFEILHAELQKFSGAEKLVQVQRDIVLKRLEKLRSQSGSPASTEELRGTLVDIIPNFSEKALKAAARANQPPRASLSKLKWAVVLLSSAAGVVWVLNLPYPMIRRPVAQKAPILLLPTYISMDYHYRQAIALVEQADQLVNQATSPADFELGEVKVKEAQKHLDALPVWFLGYSPQYTFWFGWQFTLDEFKSARASIGRMQAKLFQEKNAQNQLNQAEQALKTAKQQYQAAAGADRSSVVASWQAGLDQLGQIPSTTLAGRTAQTRLAAGKRDFEQVYGLAAGSARTGTLIQAAQQYAITADQAAQNPPHSATEWEEIAGLWEQAINQLKRVPLEDPGYVEAQKFQANYQRNLGMVRTRLQAEQASVEALKEAQSHIQNLIDSTPADGASVNRNQLVSQLQGIMNQLETVQSGTTAYPKAQELLQLGQNKLNQLQPK